MTNLIDVVVPSVGEGSEPVLLVAWSVRPGDRVQAGEPLFEIETNKAVFEVEAEADGFLAEILVEEGGTAAPGAVVARIRA